MVPTIFTVIQQSVATADDDIAVAALDSFAEIAESSVQLLAPFTKQVFTFLLQLLMAEDGELAVKSAAAQVMVNIFNNRPKATVKAGLVPSVGGNVARACVCACCVV